jgi:uncharacterized protein
VSEPESGTLQSPCSGECSIDPVADRCRGCRRTLFEITHWVRYTHEERREIMVALPLRAVSTVNRR